MRLTISSNVPRRFHGEVRAVVAAAFKGTKDAGVEIHVKAKPRGETEFTGGAYPWIPSMANVARTSRYLVTLTIPRELGAITYPRTWRYPRLKTAPEFLFCCWQAELFHLAAHEAGHVRQFRSRRPFSEVKAERWAARCMERVPCMGGCSDDKEEGVNYAETCS